MKLLLKKKESSCTVIIVAAAIACLGPAQRSDAAVTWVVAEVGSDVVIHTVGSLNLPLADVDINFRSSSSFIFPAALGIQQGRTGSNVWVGSGYGGPPWVQIPGAGSTHSHQLNAGRADSWSGDILFTQGSYAGAPGVLNINAGVYSGTPVVYSPVSTMTYLNSTIDSLYGDELDSGPVLIWSTIGTGDQIFVARAVPEPSSSLLSVLGFVGFMLRRRR